MAVCLILLCIVGDLAFGQVSGKRTRWDFEVTQMSLCGGFFQGTSYYKHLYDFIYPRNSIAFAIPFRKIFNL